MDGFALKRMIAIVINFYNLNSLYTVSMSDYHPRMFVLDRNSVYYCSFPNHHLQDGYGQTPLMWAAANGHEACVRSLLMKGMNVQIKHHADFHT